MKIQLNRTLKRKDDFDQFYRKYLALSSHLAWININQSGFEEMLVKEGVEYLSKKNLSQKRMGIIVKRAEIGSNAFSSRTILPLLIIPFLFTYFSGKISSETQEISSETQLVIVIMIMLIGMSFILELDRANMDVLIRQICVSYIPPKREKKAKE